MGKLAHVSKVNIRKEPGNSKVKRIGIQGFPDVIRMGVHGGIADFFKLKPDEPLPSTLDYVVAAVGGCLTGTLAGRSKPAASGLTPTSSKPKPRGGWRRWTGSSF